MPDRRRVCVLTGTRAEYGLLVPILRRLREDDRFDLKLVAAGSHLSLLHGETYRQIESDGFRIDAKVEMLLASDSRVATGKSLGLALIEFAGLFDRLSPEVLVLLGDRSEALAGAVAATVCSVPIAHIHGGETTEGAYDDAIRHAITKLSHLHFTATDDFRRRVIQMGENPERVYTVGAPSVEAIKMLRPLPTAELEQILGAHIQKPLLLLVYHPVTLPGEEPARTVQEILAAVEELEFGTLAISLPNADPRFAEIRERLIGFASGREDVIVFSSIGHEAFLSLLGLADIIVGNSSCGIIEAPSLRTISVNVGIRQQGRPRAESVIDCEAETVAIREACEHGLRLAETGDRLGGESPYDVGLSSAVQVTEILAGVDLPKLLLKRFFEIDTNA